MKPCPLIAGAAAFIHDQQTVRFFRVAGQPTNVYLVRRPGGPYERLADVIDVVAADLRVAPSLLLDALTLASNSLPTRSVTL